MKEAGFWGVSMRTHTHTPKSGYLSRKFQKAVSIFIIKRLTLKSNAVEWERPEIGARTPPASPISGTSSQIV